MRFFLLLNTKEDVLKTKHGLVTDQTCQ